MKNNPILLACSILITAFGGTSVALNTTSDGERAKIDSLTIEVTQIKSELKALGDIVKRNDDEAKLRDERNRVRFDKLNDKLDRTLDLLRDMKK